MKTLPRRVAVKEKLERKRVPRMVARGIARFYSGHSFAVVARKMKTGQGIPS